MTDYLIFARRAFQQPLELLGALRVDDEAQAGKTGLAERARGQFGQEGWIEMIAIPRSAVVQVIPVANA
jgi:hypothetical protein